MSFVTDSRANASIEWPEVDEHKGRLGMTRFLGEGERVPLPLEPSIQNSERRSFVERPLSDIAWPAWSAWPAVGRITESRSCGRVGVGTWWASGRQTPRAPPPQRRRPPKTWGSASWTSSMKHEQATERGLAFAIAVIESQMASCMPRRTKTFTVSCLWPSIVESSSFAAVNGHEEFQSETAAQTCEDAS